MMDSIERMRRINDLTRELKQHGFAESSFEAIRQANQIYGPDEIEDHVKHGIIRKNQSIKDTNMRLEDEKMDENIVNTDKKIIKVSENVDVLTEKVNEIIRAINDLDARITEIKQTQNKLIIAISESKSEARVEQKNTSNSSDKILHDSEKSDAKSGSEAKPLVKDEYSTNQRTGNFQSQDVAIDKMFYYGNKK